MKKLLLLVLLSATALRSNAQVMQEGDNSVNLYYGVNLVKTFYKNLADEADIPATFTGVGPVGIVFEHMVSDMIGLGGEIGYSSTEMRFGEYIDPYSTTGPTYYYMYQIKIVRVQGRLNVHFLKHDNLDMYGLFNVGYRGTSVSFETNDPYAMEESISSLVPVGVKIGLGLRYFFTPAIGLNAEFAIGSPLIAGGLSFKF